MWFHVESETTMVVKSEDSWVLESEPRLKEDWVQQMTLGKLEDCWTVQSSMCSCQACFEIQMCALAVFVLLHQKS